MLRLGEHLLSTDHVDRAVGQRHHIEIAVRSRDKVRADAEVLAGDQTPALALVEFVIVVIDQVGQRWIAEGKVLTCRVQLELEEVAACEKSSRGADEEVVGMVRS